MRTFFNDIFKFRQLDFEQNQIKYPLFHPEDFNDFGFVKNKSFFSLFVPMNKDTRKGVEVWLGEVNYDISSRDLRDLRGAVYGVTNRLADRFADTDFDDNDDISLFSYETFRLRYVIKPKTPGEIFSIDLKTGWAEKHRLLDFSNMTLDLVPSFYCPEWFYYWGKRKEYFEGAINYTDLEAIHGKKEV